VIERSEASIGSTEIDDLLAKSELADSLQVQINELHSALLLMRMNHDAEQQDQAMKDLIARDYALGILAELGESRARLTYFEAALKDAIEDLAAEKTRAYNAEKLVRDLSPARDHLRAIQNSRTWKIGRFFMLPARLIRRISR
jgi:hypothetical protein